MRFCRIGRLRLVPALALAGAAAASSTPAAAQVQADSAAPAVAPVPPDSAAGVHAPAGLFLGHHRVALPPMRPLLGPRLAGERLAPHWTDLSGRWWRQLDASLASSREALWRELLGPLQIAGNRRTSVAVAPDSVRYLPYTEERDTTPTLESFLPGRVGHYADLGMLVTGRGEMGGAWQRFEPCDATGLNTCEQGLTPRLRPDLQFGVLLGGTITDRVHIAVDYDQAREFDAANNLNVYYQGLEDEILQRFEMGDVSITMPQSQYLTGRLPVGNFGFRALAQIGPLELQSVWAQQQGDIGQREITFDPRTGGTLEESSITLDDHAYAKGRFFFLLDPALLPGYPHVDAIELQGSSVDPSIRPDGASLQIYRDEQLSPSQHDASRVFLGFAEYPDQADTLSGHFRRLDYGSDYVVHPSGLWIMLRQPLGANESLAMSYLTETGDTVGTIDAGTGGAQTPVLRLLRGPINAEPGHHPQSSTWDFEMHQVYQLFAGELEPQDIVLQIKLGDAAQGQSYVDFGARQVPLLELFGVDEQSPIDRVDPERLFFPSEYQGPASTITGTYLVFPTLRPFAEPPPSRQLTATQAAAALGSNANVRIYEERDPDLRESARFRLALDYSVKTGGLMSEFDLGGFGVREGSERITIDGQLLRRGVDYTVDYTTGTVRLSNPQQLFGGRQSPRIAVQFEQNALFEIAPKSLFGTTARWRLGQIGELNLVGLYQNQPSVMARPQLGNEPSSVMMGGMTTNLRFGAGWMDRMLDAIPGLRLAGESSIGVTGELAMSLPNPNTRGLAWLDDFEAIADLMVPMSQQSWRLGSRPGTAAGATGWMPIGMDQTNAFRLTWQHQAFGGQGASFGAFNAERIDTMIVSIGEIPEPVLYVSMKDPGEPLATGERVWRSMTTVLSTRGSDLTSSEYLEFYALESTSDIALVLDIGTVSEDAFFFDTTGATNGLHPVTNQPWGLGVLDQEVPSGQPWGRDLDIGLWNQDCQTEPGMIALLGSPNANCTRNNGINDTEDLNGDGVGSLDDGAHFRYVVPIGPGSPYLARDRAQTGTDWRLYRIPLRGAGAFGINGADEDTWRAVRHLRMTVTSGNCTDVSNCRADALLLARMRISGSTWKKRGVDGVIAGLVGRDTIPGDHSQQVHVGPVSRLTDGSAYRGPPGTASEASDPSQGIGSSGIEVNEKGLRLLAADLEPDTRAEAFYRFPSETRSFMQYGELRLWALPRAGDWGPDGTLSLLVKIGTDDGNYYLFRSRLRPPVENRDIDTPAYWLPELTIEFDEWFELKAQAEIAAVQSGDSARAVWNEDSTYAIVLASRAQAPNLAAIRELSIAVHNEGGLPADSIELWINDLRLADGRTDAGYAGVVSVDAIAADFATVRFSMSNRDALFHPLDSDATLEGANDMGLSGRLELGHFAPAGWGVLMPLTVQHNRQLRSPEFLNRTDIRAGDLEGLRESGSSQTQVGVSVSKATPAANPWLGLLVDGARLSLNWRDAQRDQFTQSSSTEHFSGTLGYQHQLRPRLLDVTPSFVTAFLRALAPARVEQSDFFGRVSNARLRWSPSDVAFTTTYTDQKSETFSYRTVLEGPGDAAIVPVRSPQQDLEQSASLGVRPFESISATVRISSARDLLGGNDLQTTPFGQRAVADARSSIGGFDVGWEKSRALQGTIDWQPRIATWLRPTVGWTSEYRTSRTPHYLDYEIVTDSSDPDSIVADTIGSTMQRDFEVVGELERRLFFDPGGLARSAWGAQATPGLGTVRGLLHRTMSALLPIDLTWTDDLESSFERRSSEPGYRYRLAFGDLESLRFVNGDTAATASERNGFQARGGVRLPFDLQLDATYAQNDRRGVNSRGSANDGSNRTWPDLRLGIASLPLPESFEALLARASASVSYRVEHAASSTGSFRSDRESESVPVQFSTTFTNGVSATYTGTFGTSQATESTGERHGRDRTHGVQLRATFDAPESLGPSFDQPMTASLGFNYSANRICTQNGVGIPADSTRRCAVTTDRLSRDIHLTIETMIDDLNLGAQFSLNDHQNFTGMRDGQSEFRLAIFANFNFGVGILPAGLGAGRMGY